MSTAITIHRSNDDTPHRCPECHAVAVRSNHDIQLLRVYGCPWCAALFMRKPWLFPLVRVRRPTYVGLARGEDDEYIMMHGYSRTETQWLVSELVHAGAFERRHNQ